jgi:hypothetical protein
VSRIARVYEVLIASPSDVQSEREILAQTVFDWNSAHSRTTGIILQPLRWEFDTVPSVGDDPQSIITQEIVRSADILIGVFWRRFGTRTKRSLSGTVEEIEHFRATGKDVLLYFSQAPLPYDHDPEQLRLLKEYKAAIGSHALFWDFHNQHQLKVDAAKHLASVINTLLGRHAWTIEYPVCGARVPARVSVSGAIGHLSADNRAWLAVELNSGHIYPQCRIGSAGVKYDEAVRIGVLESGISTGQKFLIKLVSVGPESDYQFDKYVRGESDQKDWLYPRWPNDARVMETVWVIRDD